MIKADDLFWRQFGMLLVLLTAFVVAMSFLGRSIGGAAFERSQNGEKEVLARIAPVAQVRIGDPTKTADAPVQMAAAAPAAGPAKSGEEIYNTVCTACHTAGVAGAPKFGDKAAWDPRFALGLDALVASATKGKGAMPPKGGMASLSDAELRAAIVYMLAGTGYDVAGAAPAPAAAAPAAPAAAAPAAAAPAAATPAVAAAPAAASGGKPGEEVYNMACMACHAAGVAGAPKFGDKAAWEPRAAQGIDGLLNSVTTGKGAMPPKAGRTDLDPTDLRNAILYMLGKAGVNPG